MKGIATKILLLTFMSSLFIACYDDDNTVNSDGVATGQIYATFQIIADGDDYVYAEAQLTDGIPPLNTEDEATFVQLVGNDELWLSAGEDLREVDISDDIFGSFSDLEDTQAPFKSASRRRESYDFLFSRVIINELGTWYSARLPESEEREYHISLFRDRDDGTTARDSIVTLPESFNVTSPVSGDRMSRSGDDIVVQWSNADSVSSIEVEANTTCQGNSFDSVSVSDNIDVGMLTISAGVLDSELLSGTCSTTLNVRKIRVGQFDSKFIGGAVNGYQIRRIVFISEP